jgi:DNA-binding response OmpR family regulator
VNILIIEDDQNKLKQLKDFLTTNYKDVNIREAKSYNGGLSVVLKETFEVILLDMSLPTFDPSTQESGGRPRSFAGHEILFQMKKKNRTCPVIIVTQFEEFGEGVEKISLSKLSKKLDTEFPESYLGTVYYSPARTDWQHLLQVHIEKAVKVK